MNQENQGVNYSMALKNYNKNGHGIGLRFIGVLGISEVRVRFTNGMELIQSNGDINELFGIVRKLML